MADTPLSAQMEDEYKVSKWNRNTVADGTWLQKYTIEKLNDRDIFLANAIDTNSDDIREALNQEIETRTNDDVVISAALTGVSGDFYTFSANVENSASTIVNTIETFSSYVESSAAALDQKINNESNRAQDREDELANKIYTLEAATDVIMVYGTYPDFINTSAELWNVSAGYLTENDVVKILIDDSQGNSANQTYYQAKNVDYDTSSCTWTKIGELDPYYNTAQIDEYFNILSGTITDNYLSANENAVSAGKNIKIDYEQNKPKITINTKEDVEFNNVSSKNVSATNVTALTVTGNSAKFTNISANKISADLFKSDLGTVDTFNLKFISAVGDKLTVNESNAIQLTAGTIYGQSNNSNVDSLIGSAQNGEFAYNVINSAKFSAVGTTTSTAYISGGFAIKAGDNLSLTYADKTITLNAGDTGITAISAGNTQYTGPVFSASAGTGINFVNGNNNVLAIKASDTLINSATGGSAAYNWITAKSATLQAGQGIGFYSAGPNILGISAEGTTYQASSYISTADKKISVTGTLITSAEAGSAASAWINNTLFDFSYYEGTDPETASGSIDKITILYKNDYASHNTMLNQEIVFNRGDYRVSGLLIQAAKDTDNGKVLTYNSTANNYTWQAIPDSTYTNVDGYISIDNTDRTINLSTSGIKTSAYSAEYISAGNHYFSMLNGEKLKFSYGQSTLDLSLTGVSHSTQSTHASAKWDNLFKNYAEVNRELLSDSNLTTDKVNFIVATGSSGTQPYKVVNFVVTATLPSVLSADVYYII